MGFTAPVVEEVSEGIQDVVEEVPIVGQPAAELVQEISKPTVQVLEEVDKPFIELYQEVGILPEAPDLPAVETPEPIEFQESGEQPVKPTSNRQFESTATKPRRRGSGRQGTALGSILLAPSVLGTKSAQLGQGATGSLG